MVDPSLVEEGRRLAAERGLRLISVFRGDGKTACRWSDDRQIFDSTAEAHVALAARFPRMVPNVHGCCGGGPGG